MTVHFQSVVEKFTPHDTIFSFTNSVELKDSRLSSACSLHTASASIKSSTDSLRPPALSEIAEDAQENQSGGPDDWENPTTEPSLAGESNRARVAVSKYSNHPDVTRATSTKRSLSPAQSTRTVRNTDKALPPTPPEIDHQKVYAKSTYEGDQADNRPSLDARFSFQSTRPATREIHGVYEYKPKIKLGPRPSAETATRSHTSESPRPVSMLPPSVRIPSRKAAPTRSKSQSHPQSHREMNPFKAAALSPPLPVMPVQTLEASHSTSGTPVTPARPMSSKSPAITPEKRRLMKALQLRQKQLAAQALKSSFGSESVASEPELGPAGIMVETTVEVAERKNDFRNSEATISEGSEIVQVFIEDMTKSNFHLDSSPISVIEPSDGQSTQASSVTDEDIPKVETKVLAWASPERTNETEEGLPDTVLAEDNNPALDDPSTIASKFTAAVLVEPVLPEGIPLPPADESEMQDLNTPRDSLRGETESGYLTQSVPEDHLSGSSIGHLPNGVEGDANATRPSTSETCYRGGLGDVLRVHGKAVSLKRASTPENSEDHFLSDDSFMEELRSATVQEAKPISVSLSKSPIAPVFPRRASDHQPSEAGKSARSVSNPIQDVKTEGQTEISQPDSTLFSARSLSASHHQQPRKVQPQQASAILLKKVGVSSGISQRIKALEQLSSRPTSPSSQGQSSVNPDAPSPAYVSLRKVSLKSLPLKSDSDESMGSKIHPKLSTSSMSSSLGPVYRNQKEKSLNVKMEGKSKKSPPNSISVTATIIRDPRNQMPAGPIDLADPNVRELCRSPLLVEHQSSGRESPTPPPPLKPPRSRFASPRSVSSSSTEPKGERPPSTRRDSLTSKRSMTSGRESEADLSRSFSDTSVNGVNGHDGSKEEKKESRKSRLFKRMSGISSASRRSIVQALSPSLKEGPIVEHHEPMYEAPKPLAAFGDVNVQFPDTLVRPTAEFSTRIVG